MVFQIMEELLENKWIEDYPDRDYRVPQPAVDIEKDRDKIRLRGQDHINIVDGGDVTYEPKGVGYVNEEINETYNIEVRTTANPPDAPDTSRPGRTRFDGYKGSGDYEGLKGEIKRILEHIRKSNDYSYDIIQATTWRDDSGNYGANHYYGMWIVEPSTRGACVQPPDPNNDF